MAINIHLSIITLNVNGLNNLIKRPKVAGWIRKHDPHIVCLKETHLTTKDLHRLKVKGWKKYSKQIDRKKKSHGSYTLVRKNRLKTKAIKGDRRTLYNTQRKNTSRRHKHCKHICTPNRSTQIYKGILTRFQKIYRQ